MLEAVFESTEQALSIAYLLEHIPASGKSVMQVAMESLKQKAGESSSDKRSRVDFHGLSAMEIRGQCAAVRSQVEVGLPDDEKNAIQARYGWYETKGKALAYWAQRVDCGLSAGIICELLCNIYRARGYNRKGKAACPLSLRRIAEQHGASETALKRSKRRIISYLRKQEISATAKLELLFLDKGLIAGG